MNPTIKGKVTQMGTVQTGTSKSGKEWSKVEFMVQFGDEKFPESICITALPADKADPIQVGADVECWVNYRAREYNGRFYNQIDLWKVEVEQGNAVKAEPYNAEQFSDAGDHTDLPF